MLAGDPLAEPDVAIRQAARDECVEGGSGACLRNLYVHVSYSLDSLEGVTWESIIGVIKGDTRSLDYGSCHVLQSARYGFQMYLTDSELNRVRKAS